MALGSKEIKVGWYSIPIYVAHTFDHIFLTKTLEILCHQNYTIEFVFEQTFDHHHHQSVFLKQVGVD
jgi:hypothetical protein